MHVGDWVLRAIGDEIAAQPPERGGALLGPPQRPVVTRFVADPEAAVTSSSYRPSRALDARVKEMELHDDLELKGIVHSHPRGFDRPSERDAAELATGLRLNGHMATYLAPIVTTPAPEALGENELAVGPGKISFFAAHRTRSDGAQVRPCRVHVVPLFGDLERVAEALGCAAPEPFVSDAGAGSLLAARFELDGATELLLLTTEHYPALAPVLLVTVKGSPTEQLQVPWRLDVPAGERLTSAVAAAFAPPGPYRRAFGPRGGPALTRDVDRARLAGWEVRFTGGDPEANAESLRSALFERSEGLLSRALRDRRALVVGCGSVGSYLAEQLARAGTGRFTLVDPEVVEPANLSRTAYDVTDLGTPKPRALARVLLHVAPAVSLVLAARAVEQLDPVELDAMVQDADLVVAATDDPSAQRTLNRFAYARGRPALFVGLYAGARGGEVVLSVPGRTPCYLCATAARHRAEQAAGRVTREVDYGTGRLRGEQAIAADIHHVASAAAKLGLALLLPEGCGAALGRFTDDPLGEGMSYLTLSTVPRYWFYPEIFKDAPGQAAFQSVWLTPTRRPECPVCGTEEKRVDPLAIPLRPPSAAALAAAVAAGRVTPP